MDAVGRLSILALLSCVLSSCTLIFTEPSCAKIFPEDGGDNVYGLCPEANKDDLDACFVNAHLLSISCNSFCESYGTTCLYAVNTPGAKANCETGEQIIDTCEDTANTSEICVCTRG